jgi:hypothetical protein
MVTHEGDVREGMEAVGLDGESLGTVARVWIKEVIDATPHELARGMPPASGEERSGYFLVQDRGEDLYVPFEAIFILFPGQNLTVGSTVEECRQRYRTPPAGLSSCRLVQPQMVRVASGS